MPKIKLPRKIRDLVKKANGGCGEAAFKLSRHSRRTGPQQKDWARGTEQHPPHRETCSRVVNGIVPPGVFARLRDDAAKNREASN